MDGIAEKVTDFVRERLLAGSEVDTVGADVSLIDAGVVDSTGILELIEFLEAEFGIIIEDDEALTENLDDISRITGFVQRKLDVSN